MKSLVIKNKGVIFVSRNKTTTDMKTALHKADFSKVIGTSYYGHTLTSTVNKIAEAIGEPHSGASGDGKVSVEWRFITDNGLL